MSRTAGRAFGVALGGGGAARVVATLIAVAVLAVAALAVAPSPASAQGAPGADCPPPPKPLTPQALEAGLKTARDRGFFWRITKNGRSSYLYGTVHAARFEWMFPGPTLQEALQASDVVALELDVLDPQIQQQLRAAIRGGRPDEKLSPALSARLARKLAAACIDAAAVAGFMPEFQVASLAVAAARQEGLEPAYAIDLVLAVLARRAGKPVASLETPEQQMLALQMPNREQTEQMVKAGLDDLDAGRARPLIRRIAKAWTESDYADLERYEQWCQCLRNDAERAAMQRLLGSRNPEIATGIDVLHTNGKTVFAAVGSLHLFGPTGLPSLLRQRGYKVEQGAFTR